MRIFFDVDRLAVVSRILRNKAIGGFLVIPVVIVAALVVITTVLPYAYMYGSIFFKQSPGALALHPQRQQYPIHVASQLHTHSVTPVSQIRKSPTAPSSNDALMRIGRFRIAQLDVQQYASVQEHDLWSPSTCSAAAMTVVLNAYGGHYRIADILKVESALGAITPEQGLVDPQGIEHTLHKFNFTAVQLNQPDLDTVIALANQGYPIIVNFPPALWPGGHFLVLFGGNSQEVYTADSSQFDKRIWQRQDFLRYWQGFASIVVPTAKSVIRAPTISADLINLILAQAGSPAAGQGQFFYDLGVKYTIDPAFALAFYKHESGFGTQGIARESLSIGNIRCAVNTMCITAQGSRYFCAQDPCEGFRAYSSWQESIEDWYQLIAGPDYARRGLITVALILPKYAPSADKNDEALYISSIENEMNAL